MTGFESEPYFRAQFRSVPGRQRFAGGDAAAVRTWQAALRPRLSSLLGLERMHRTDPAPLRTERIQCDGYVRERVEIDTEPGIAMPFYVLVPDGLQEPVPAVLALHGHSSGGKYAPAGRRDISDALTETIDRHNYDYGVQAVREGYVVFIPDARGFGERREAEDAADERLLESSCRHLAHMGLPLGLTVAGMWTWDLMRLLDYVATRPETQGRRVGCIGFSGGGLQTLYLSALDERVACAVISGYFYGVEDSLLHMSGNCDCNYVPGLWETVDMGDVAGLIAPRPLLIETARGDPLNGPRGVENVREQYAITQRAYTAAGATDRLTHVLFEGGHQWRGVEAMAWLDRWLGPSR